MKSPFRSRLTLAPFTRLVLLLGLLCFGIFSGLLPGVAQDAAPADPAAQTENAEEAPLSKELTILEMYQLGGWSMHFLLLGSVATIALVTYNALMLRPGKMLGLAHLPEIQEEVSQMNFPRVLEICEAHPCMFLNIIRAGFDRVNEAISPAAIESGMEEAAVEEVQKNMMTVSYLSVIAVVAPMVGLLGTVSGMIKAFRAMAMGGMGRPELLADNISEALVTTAGGLIVGIPAMIFYFVFKSRVMATVAKVTRLGGDLVQRMKRALRLYQAGQLQPPPGLFPSQEDSAAQ